jgi:D-alanine transaminase
MSRAAYPDIRWQRCDIKSVALLPNVPGKQRANEAGAFEAWQVDGEGEGKITEGTSTNAWIVSSDATVVTRQEDGNPVANGQPDPLSRKLRKAYLAHAVTAGSVA